jgi:hypothetical protein
MTLLEYLLTSRTTSSSGGDWCSNRMAAFSPESVPVLRSMASSCGVASRAVPVSRPPNCRHEPSMARAAKLGVGIGAGPDFSPQAEE